MTPSICERLRQRIPIAEMRVGKTFSAWQMSGETLDEAAATIESQAARLNEVATRILVLLGGERDAMPDHVVKAFQEIATLAGRETP